MKCSRTSHVINLAFAVFVLGCPLFLSASEPSDKKEIYNSEPLLEGLLSPEQALAALKLPAGFSATLFASEPEVQNPIAATVDHAGRVWVAENYTYAERSQRFDLDLDDRVVVLQDTDDDGIADSRVVFTDQVKMLTGITVGQGGVWLMCPPQLLFIPDADGDLVPDGPPEVKLDGFHVARENYHNFANGLSWGPDGWLYGRCGASCPGEMGLPGKTKEERILIRGGIWRYHPQKEIVEALTHGTTNPWGHDWNAAGELFFINTVNGHLWHALPGAHFDRPHTIDANPHIYELLNMHADHWHFDTGRKWSESRDGAANEFGGGHAHIGMMICHSEVWPERYRGKLMTVNMHGRRINVEDLNRHGSGYLASHDKDFLLSDDTWFRGMDLLPTPDGNMLLIDWSDTGECHEHSGVHRTSGRIFKINYTKQAGSPTRPLKNLPPAELAKVAIDDDEWHARQARRLLRERFLTGQNCEAAKLLAESRLASQANALERLRALWVLNSVDAAADDLLLGLLADKTPELRNWAIRLLIDTWPIDSSDGTRPARETNKENIIAALIKTAQTEDSSSVRLTLASALQRFPLQYRASLAAHLVARGEDADDHNLPLMTWYGLTGLGNQRLEDLVTVSARCEWPELTRLIARRCFDQLEEHPDVVASLLSLAAEKPAAFSRAIVNGASEALQGRQKQQAPSNWQQFASLLAERVENNKLSSNETQDRLRSLNVLFGDGRALSDLVRLARDGGQPLDIRRSALASLVDARAEGIKDLCIKSLRQRYLNTVAAEGLARESDNATGKALLANFFRFAQVDRPRVISILCSRANWSLLLLEAIADGTIERDAISPFQARQIASHADASVNKLLTEHWGQIRETPAARKQAISQLKKLLESEVDGSADLSAGRALFKKNCASCHRLFGDGGELGPDLTGAQRSDLDYLVQNIMDPSAVVTNEFKATIVMLEDDRIISGLAMAKTEKSITIATQDETAVFPMSEVVSIKQSDQSTMPEGLLSQLSEKQKRDLFAYLRSTRQVPLPPQQ